MTRGKVCTIYNAKINWSYFQKLLTSNLDNIIPLKANDDIICAVESFNHAAQWRPGIPTYSDLNINMKY